LWIGGMNGTAGRHCMEILLTNHLQSSHLNQNDPLLDYPRAPRESFSNQ